MKTAKHTFLGLLLVATLCTPALAANQDGRRVRPSHTSLHPATFSARNVALRYAQQRYGRLGTVTLAPKPLLKTQDGTHITQAFGISINGERRTEAVIVQGGGITGRYSGLAIADVHKIAPPRGNKQIELPATFHRAVILRVRGRRSSIEAKQYLQEIASGLYRGTRSAALMPVFPEVSLPVAGRPGVQPAIWPGPTSYAPGKAVISSKRGSTEVSKGFHRYVMFGGDGNPTPPVLPASGGNGE